MDSLVQFDLDRPATNSPRSVARSAKGKSRQGTKRKKYTARACHDCKRRKVKCSGDDACQQCRSRKVRCRYSPPATRFSGEEDAASRRQPSRANSAHLTVPLAQGTENSLSPGIPSELSDPRVDGLCYRVKAIERMLNHLLKSAKITEDISPGAISQTPAWPSVPDEDYDTDQFAVRATAQDDLSLSSQVAAMSAFMSRPPSPKHPSGKQNATVEVLIEFPDPLSLQHSFDVYFREMDCYFPFLDRQDTESSIYSAINRLGYSSYNRMLVVANEDLSIIALACIMLALAECVDSGQGVTDGDTKPGRDRYLQSCRAIHRFSRSRLDLNIVRAQCLVAAYLMHCETLGAASEAVYLTWRFVTSIRLNNKRAWPKEDPEQNLQRQRLWWTIYYLDRQISRRSGLAYHIRDTEFDVDDFSSDDNTADSDSLPTNDWHSSTTGSYLQGLIGLARLWGQVWDTIFAVGATKRGDWMEVEMMDARILNARRQLPKRLTWNSDELASYTLNGEDEPHIRRRLQLFTRSELLRMLIRQNPLQQPEFNLETAHFCARLACEIIKSHDLYISRYPEARAIGYFATSSTVECIYHLAPVIHYSKADNERTACISAFDQAHGILVRLSVYNNVAKRALKALNGIVKKWGNGNANSNNGAASASAQLSEVGDYNMIDTTAPQAYNFPGSTLQNGASGLDVNLGEWMQLSMGPLYDNDFDFRPTPQA